MLEFVVVLAADSCRLIYLCLKNSAVQLIAHYFDIVYF